MISHEHKCIFIHIPKTAGTSIESKLGCFQELSWGVQDHRTIREIQPFTAIDLIKQDPRFGSHIPRSTILKTYLRQTIKPSPILSRKQYKTYFKFAFIRNSWSRVASWYKNVLRDERHQKRFGIPSNCSFKEFLLCYPEQQELKSQLFWLLDRQGRLPYDFIGRFENLTSDFTKVCDALDIKDKSLPKLLKTSDGSHYIDLYDEETKHIVAERYREEIELFGFKFGE